MKILRIRWVVVRGGVTTSAPTPSYRLQQASEAEFLIEIQTKVLRVVLLVILSHLYSFALRFLFLQTHTVSVKEKGGKPDRKPYPLSYKNPYRSSSLRFFKIMPETSTKLYVH
jgi:hypothetical protein